MAKINSYDFSLFSLTDVNFKNLECRGKTKAAWIHGETNIAYFEKKNKSAFVVEFFQTNKIFCGHAANLKVMFILKCPFIKLFIYILL